MENKIVNDKMYYFDVLKVKSESEKNAKNEINKKIRDGRYSEVAIWCMNQFYSSRSPVMATMACFYLKVSGKSLVLDEFIRFIVGFDPSIVNGFSPVIREYARKILDDSSIDLTEPREARQAFRADHRWPRDISLKSRNQLCQTFESLYEKFNNQKALLISDKPKFVTIGSCFAVNISRSLDRLGYDCFNVQIDERRNSTDRISGIFSEVLDQDFEGQSLVLEEQELDLIKSKILDASHIIVTLGVSLVFKDESRGVYDKSQKLKDIISGKLTPYIISSDENIEYIKNIIKLVDNEKTQLIFSISPVPLTWANCSVGELIYYDMQSKNSLLEAVHSACRDSKVIYWPSFELIKWFGAHSSDPFFGVDHPDSRHVRDEVVDLVTSAFTSKISRVPQT